MHGLLSVLFFMCGAIVASEHPIDKQEVMQDQSQDIETLYQKAFADLCVRAKNSLVAKEKIITSEWLAAAEIKEIKNIMSDLAIDLSFNAKAQKMVTEKLQAYLAEKVRSEIELVGERDGAKVDDIKQFLYLSEMVCNLSQGTDCDRMMHAIKNENFALITNVKIKRKVRKQVRKEERQELCKIIALGALPRERLLQ